MTESTCNAVQAPSIQQSVNAAHTTLIDTPSTSPRLDAELIVGHVLGASRTWLLVHSHDPLSAEQQHRIDQLVAKRQQGWPVAYLTGRRAFANLDLAVRPGVLVPRPETEQLVEIVIANLQQRSAHSYPLVIDVGTGSGAIALAIAQPGVQSKPVIIGSDSSVIAISSAVENARRERLHDVAFLRGDLLTWLGQPADVLVANLPYLRPDQVQNKWDLSREPRNALVGGRDGLDLVRRLLDQAVSRLNPSGLIALELDPSNIRAAAKTGRSLFPNADITVHQDLAGDQRFLTITGPRSF